jgi:hypothetical protein
MPRHGQPNIAKAVHVQVCVHVTRHAEELFKSSQNPIFPAGSKGLLRTGIWARIANNATSCICNEIEDLTEVAVLTKQQPIVGFRSLC